MLIHIVIVSDHSLANIIPALLEKPDLVYMVCSASMEKKGVHTRLKRFLNARNIGVELQTGVSGAGFEAIQLAACELEDNLKKNYPEAELVLNVTGGTKLLAMGFYSVLSGSVSRVIYTDTARSRIENIPGGKEPPQPPTDIPNLLDVPTYLETQGFKYSKSDSDVASWEQEVQERKAACKFLISKIGNPRVKSFIKSMNSLVGRAIRTDAGFPPEQYLSGSSQTLSFTPSGVESEIMSELARGNVIKWNNGERAFEIEGMSAARYLSGGWLEEYAWHILKDAGIYDVRKGVTGYWAGSKTAKNEFDVLGCHANRMLFIECKTLDFNDEISKKKDSDVAYKVDSLGEDVRGLFGETWLLSTSKPRPNLLERAKQASFRVIGPDELPDLPKLVLGWKGSNHM